jgi:hypothetical protein
LAARWAFDSTSLRSGSFLKKRTKKLLFLRQRQDPGHGLNHGSGGEIKVFCFFSSEKKAFFSSYAARPVARTMKNRFNAGMR